MGRNRSSEFIRHTLLIKRDLAALLSDGLDLVQNFLVLLRVPPFLVPVKALAILLGRLSCRLKNELGDVHRRGADNTAVGEVLDHVASFMTDRGEVESVTARVQSQDHVELLNQHGRRLVDRTHDSLSGLRKLLQETHDGKGRLTVQTASGLVEEKKKTGLGSQLDTDGDALLLQLHQGQFAA